MLETVAMAYLGTMLAVVFAVPLGFLGARNVIPHRVFHFLTRRLFDGLRGLDQLIWALVFVRAMGLGPIAGIMAIAVAETGVLAKLFAEAIENIDRNQVEGIISVGAGSIAPLRFAVLPQVLPVMISQTLYSIESNSREATILGLVGAGGIGLRLSERIQINAWDQVAYVIVLILISVAVIDTISRYLRMRLIGVQGSKGGRLWAATRSRIDWIAIPSHELTTATASISTMKSGPARRVTPTVVLVGVATPK